MQSKIVACLIVKNEEQLLSRCLDSIKGVDNIYIADTGSEDNTVAIAKKYTDNVYTDFTWCDDFAKARNHVLSKVKEENAYVLSIDADEYLHDFEEIKKSVEVAEKTNILSIDVGLIAEDNGQVHYFPRLFKKDPRVWWEAAAHNHISVAPGLTSGAKITYGYSPAHLKDPNRTFRILSKKVQEPDCSPRYIFYLGREYWYRRMYKECVETMGKYVQKAHFLAEKADAFLIMSRCYQAMNMWSDARDACAQCLIINPHFKEAVLWMSKLAGKGSGHPTWEKNGDFWENAAKISDNSGVLFIREDQQ